MQIITDNQEANELLKKYKGARLDVAMYNESMSKIAIRLTLPFREEIVFIIGLACQEMNGRFFYQDADLLIVEEFVPGSTDKLILLRDRVSKFLLITTGGIVLAHGEQKEFNNSLDQLVNL